MQSDHGTLTHSAQRAWLRAMAHALRSSTVQTLRNLADRLGICLSVLCVIHCLLTPFLILLLPALHMASYHEVFHVSLLVILPVLAVLAFVPGYRRHRERQVFYWALPGLALLAFAALVLEHDHIPQAAITVMGSVFLIRAHWLNRKLCICCERGHQH